MDTPGWTSDPADQKGALTCAQYTSQKICVGGMPVKGMEWQMGKKSNRPEENCCACGKGQALETPTRKATTAKPTAAQGQHWMTIDLGKVRSVHGAVVEGGVGVKAYNVRHSLDGELWADVPGDFAGTNDAETKVRLEFKSCVQARYVRLVPRGFVGHLSLHAAVLPCEKAEPATEACADTPGWTSDAYGKDGLRCADYKTQDICAGGVPLKGMEWHMSRKENNPENNCCACGKGKALHPVPAAA